MRLWMKWLAANLFSDYPESVISQDEVDDNYNRGLVLYIYFFY